MTHRVLIVGSMSSSHIGGSFLRGIEHLGWEGKLCDTNQAWRHGRFVQKLLWHFGGRRPLHLDRFGKDVVAACRTFQPHALLSTGLAPLTTAHLQSCRQLGVHCLNFSTDDPFSSTQRAAWFLKALPHYDVVFTPRHANEAELQRLGCARVVYLPFGYDPDLFFPPPEPPLAHLQSDFFFAGMADRGRVPFIAAALRSGIDVRLHGGNWDRFPETKGQSRGQADIPTLRAGIRSCRVALCVVRHENRDGHAMRTFEVPAVGAAVMVEDTPDHRKIFGPEGECASYFQTPDEMVTHTRWLLANPAERQRRAVAAHARITGGRNTYADRLQAMLEMVPGSTISLRK